MATPRQVRRLAFQALFQMDAHASADAAAVREWLSGAELGEDFSEKEQARAIETARAAYAARAGADAAFLTLAPTWPSHRQAAVDRAILRLAHFEMTATSVPPKAVINDAVQLAKEFSTDRSPAFVNGLLDKIFKALPATKTTEAGPAESADAHDAEAASADQPDSSPPPPPPSEPEPA